MDTIKCKYIFDENYNPIYVNGAYGGVNSRGEIVINFFMERMPLPNAQTFQIKDGNIHEEVHSDREPEDHRKSVVRFIQNGIILDYKNAREIHKWLGEHISNLETNNEK